MNATVHPRIRSEGRTRLEEVIPLHTPFKIHVDPSDKCSLACTICPTGDTELMKRTPGRNYGPMPLDLFKRIADGMTEFPDQVKLLTLYKDGEPLANPRFADMVRYAKEIGAAKVIDTVTNGTYLNPVRNLEIITSGIDRINISIYGMTTEEYVRNTKRKVNVEKLIEGVRHLYEHRGKCHIFVKIIADIVSPDSVAKFYKAFGNISDQIAEEHVMGCWPGFDQVAHGNRINPEVGIYGQPIHEVTVCPYVFYLLAINSNGTASVCFLDMKRELIVGDANTERLVDIWTGERMQAHRRMMLEGRRKSHPVCGTCGQMSHGMPDDIDRHREMLLKRVFSEKPATPAS